MTNSFSIPRGTSDILPLATPLWSQIELKARDILSIYGYSEIRTPIYEDINLFKRSMGQTSDVVNKQLLEVMSNPTWIAMTPQEAKHYQDQGVLKGYDPAKSVGLVNESAYALRPEGTASVVRSYVENRMDARESLSKLFYIGPMFRGERPQKGRLRQFHQIGIEAIGVDSGSPYLDAEVIGIGVRLLQEFGLSGFKVKINSLGTKDDKENFSRILRERLKSKLSHLCEDCVSRFERNVFRVLDCKNTDCQKIVDSLEFDDQHLSAESRAYFNQVKESVASLSIACEYSPKLVRGLDYYTHTVFEFEGGGALGSQDALGAGGRYNGLVQELGGPAADAVGLALGIERILLSLGPKEISGKALNAFMVALGETAYKRAFVIVDFLRKSGISCDMAHKPGGSMKSQMRQADKKGAGYVLILGEDEEKSHSVVVKNMSTGDQELVGWDEVVDFLGRKVK
ncbi:MAG: histidine--tRNA ligase [Candidatus Omnitrophica bacterium]|nr:histidine--tRNA ligase [Candidatus Omnitrophota bacterium]